MLNSTKTTKTIINKDGKRVKRPIQVSKRKRPSKSFIESMAKIRGYMTGNEKTSLETLKLKNTWQKINNRSMSDNVEDNFTSEENQELIRLMSKFIKDVNTILKNK
jgi:hypothetical protein